MKLVTIKNVIYSVDYTTTKVFLYRGNEIVGVAGVKDPKDFDFETLCKLAAQGIKSHDSDGSKKSFKNAKQEMREMLSEFTRV